MAIRILPLEESDIPTFVRVELESFKPHPRTPIQWPQGYTPDLYAFSEQRKHESFLDGSQLFFKAVDTSTNEMVGCAQWTFKTDKPEDYGTQKLPSENEPAPANWPEEGNWKLTRWFKINLQRILNERLAGAPFIVLDNLTVHPDHQGQGVGSLLLGWGVEEADRLGCNMCLESTPSGLAIYRKFGFDEVEQIKCNMREVGDVMVPYDDEAARRIFMVRKSRS